LASRRASPLKVMLRHAARQAGTTPARACPSYDVRGVPREPRPIPTPSSATALELESQDADGFAAAMGAPLGGAAPEHDPELARLPSPPRGARTLTVLILALATISALAMTAALSREVAYAVASHSAETLGDLRSVSASVLAANENRLVRAEAMLGAAGGIRYERPFVADSFRMLPVVGRTEPLDVWVEVRVPSGQESGRWEPPQTFAGRLVRLDAAGSRHRGLRAAVEQATGEHVPRNAWLLVDGEEPDDARWAIVLAVLFLAFAGWNVASIARIVRKVRG
jgi:hypothetical protein